MSYPNSDNQEIFSLQYLEAIASADFPAIAEIRSLISALLEKPNLPPNNPKLWPLHTFISKALDQKAPINWLNSPPFVEKITSFRQVLDFLESKPPSELFQVKDHDGKPIPTFPVQDKAFMKFIANFLMSMPHLPDSEQERAHALESIDHIEIILNGNAFFGLNVVAKREAVEEMRTTVKEWIIGMVELGKVHLVTLNGNPIGWPIEIARVIENLADLVIENLHTLPTPDLSLIDHLHVAFSNQQITKIQLCPTQEVVEHNQRRQVWKH